MAALHPIIEPFKDGRNSDYENGFIAGCKDSKKSAEADRDKFVEEFASWIVGKAYPIPNPSLTWSYCGQKITTQQLLTEFKNREK